MQRDYNSSLDYCSKALILRPNSAYLYYNRGVTYYTPGSYKNAISDFSNASRLTARVDSRFYLSRAASYEKNNEIGKAKKDLIFPGKYCPGAVPALIENSVDSKWRFTLSQMNEQVNYRGSDARSFYQRSLFYFDSGLEKEGFADLSKACSLDPSNKEYLKMYRENCERPGEKPPPGLAL